VDGSDEGNGSEGRPFRTLTAAARGIEPGTAIVLHAGTYAGGTTLVDLHGTDANPIWITGAPGEAPPSIRGGGQGLHLVKPRFIVLRRLEIAETGDNGINVDDGDDYANAAAARFVVFDDLDIHDTGRHPSGIANCLKISGLNDFTVRRSRFARCGPGPGSGSVGVDGVGVHRGMVIASRFEANGFGGAQFKGGSTDIEVRGNLFLNTGWRGINMGGSTGGAFFRPPLEATAVNAEAMRIVVVGNVFNGGETAAAFAGCADCRFVHNTVIDPGKWALRILQETTAIGPNAFAPSSDGTIAGNIFFFRRSEASAGEDINVGAGTDTRSFSLARNLWYAHDQPSQSEPRLPAFEGNVSGSIAGTNPGFVSPADGDFHLGPESPARAAGTARYVSGADYDGGCYGNPPSLGALEFRIRP
jgi:hypothetical protein